MGVCEYLCILVIYGGEYNDEKMEKLVVCIVGLLIVVLENLKQFYCIIIFNFFVINVFVLLGGYFYVMCGFLVLVNDVFEVVVVLVYEMVYVMVNYGILCQQKEEVEQIVSQVVFEVLQNDVVGQQVIVCGKFCLVVFLCNQEFQVDEIGVCMLGEVGYDFYVVVCFLIFMENYSCFMVVNGDDQSFDFFFSYLSVLQCVELVCQYVCCFGQEGIVGDKGCDIYFFGIDGFFFGDSFKEGYVCGIIFLYVNLGICFDVLEGFQIDNKVEVVFVIGLGDIVVWFDGVFGQMQILFIDYIVSGWVIGLDKMLIWVIKVNGMDVVMVCVLVQKWDFDVIVIWFGLQIYCFFIVVLKGDVKLEEVVGEICDFFCCMMIVEIVLLKLLCVWVIIVGLKDMVDMLFFCMMGMDCKVDFFCLFNVMMVFSLVCFGDKFKIIFE